MGIQNLSLVEFVRLIKENKVSRVVDIRSEDLVSGGRVKFSPVQLMAILRNISVDYVHLHEAGAPKYLKQMASDNGHSSNFIDEYMKSVKSNNALIIRIKTLFADDNVVILCEDEKKDTCLWKPFSDIVASLLNEECKVKNLSAKDLKPLEIPPPEPLPPKG